MSGDHKLQLGNWGLAACAAILFFSGNVSAQEHETANSALHLMPLPRSVERGNGELVLNEHFRAVIEGAHDARLENALHRMVLRLDRQCGSILRPQQLESNAPAVLTFKVAGPGRAVQSVDEDESYRLTVTADSAQIIAQTDVGAMHAMETFLQLVNVQNGACRLPAATIEDAPRFAWRGFMIDVSRHFEPIPVIKRTLDGMTIAKLNVFHWHLSDDQGFRAESKKFPRFTEVASGGMFYTQDQMRDVVAYARARGIRVVPEFDIPGHTSSWLLAYPEIGAGEDIKSVPYAYGIPQAELDPSNEKTYKFLDTFIGEMSEIFPDEYFHIGGDETKGKGWLENPRIAEFMQKHDLKAPEDLQAYFNRRLLPILTKHGKKMMGWDEILNPALPKDIVIQSWRGGASLGEGATRGYTGILSSPYYLDAQKTSEEMFLADPIPADTKLTAEEQKRILGGEVCMWGEHINEETVDSRVWPRTLAIAERFWSVQADRDVADMYLRLRIASLELEDAGLTHITGPEKLRRSIAGAAYPMALDVLASVMEPVSFSERFSGQHTDAMSSLNRLVDAVVPDPPSRQQIAHAVDAYVAAHNASQMRGASEALRDRFREWQQASPRIEALCQRTPRLTDAATRAHQLGQLGTMGLEALSYREEHVAPPAGWREAQLAILADAEKPSALVRFTVLSSLRKLVDSVGDTQQK